MPDVAPRRWKCTPLVDGEGGGHLFALKQPLSFWGGFDAHSGRVVEMGHPDNGAMLNGCVLLMSEGKGSSSSASVLAEAVRAGYAPAAIILRHRDLIVALGCIVADELYGKAVPVALVDEDTWQCLRALGPNSWVSVSARAPFCEVVVGGSRDVSVAPRQAKGAGSHG